MSPVWEMTKALWFNDRFIVEASSGYELIRRVFEATPVQGYLGGTSAVADLNYTSDLHHISVPTLVVAAGDDPVTPVEHAREICDRIEEAQLEVIPGQRHFSNVETPDPFNALLRSFLDQHALA